MITVEQLDTSSLRANRIDINSIEGIKIRDASGRVICIFPASSPYSQKTTEFTEEDKQNLLNLLTQEE